MAEHRINEKESKDVWLQEVTSRYKSSTWSRKMTEDALGIVSIYRVPEFLKDLNQEAYHPRLVSLGLFHHKPTNPLSEMDRLKLDAVLRMRQKLPDRKQNMLAHILKDNISQIRKCYEGEVEVKDETVAWICLLDGCFILEILDVLTRPDDEAENHQQHHPTHPHNITVDSDPIYNKNRIRSCQFDILGDFFTMENQIPLVVLMKILELQMENLQNAKEWLYRRLREVSRRVHPFLPKGPLEPQQRKSKDGIEDVELSKHRHMLELFHSFVIEKKLSQPQKQKDKQNQNGKENVCLNKFINASASEICILGLKFEAYYGIPCPEKLRFHRMKAKISLPALFINDTSEMILRNLMAMEVCRPEKNKQLSSYLLLMNSLVKERDDVAVLRKAGIIQSSMGSDYKVINLLNGLCKGLNFQDDSEDPFVAMKLEVNEWFKNKVKKLGNNRLIFYVP